jgi:hypothetical protein
MVIWRKAGRRLYQPARKCPTGIIAYWITAPKAGIYFKYLNAIISLEALKANATPNTLENFGKLVSN